MASTTTTGSVEARREALTWLSRQLSWERVLADLRARRVREAARAA